MQNGIALPHARTSAVKRMVCAVGLLKEGVDFDSLDKLPSQIFFLTLSPRQSSEPQLQFIANLSKMLMSREHRGRLLSARTQGEVFRFLETHL
jgi:PTS system nitrogen regulatory IIA component